MVLKSLKQQDSICLIAYLIVMDDIWGMEAWNDIERSFPKESNRSKGPVWNTSEEGFSQLKYLSFYHMNIENWNASEDQFPRLEVVVIEYCSRLERIPIDFAHLNELCEIKLFGCTQSVEESARKIQEE
ncbi:hypothetical protein Vadar_029670 [Vaccinium darrowii]|uniref:Uncharacterized protein n=1 Tax=Vaccinium darrowii TaxID=229202 RepID=A0ACB7Y2Z6_9ERIC|nr:hypothetical protein Vadar_029670 [Vaccinium darrowii]